MNIIITQIAGWVAISGFAGMFCFQVALALGAPLGKLAWGGKYQTLPNDLRIASLFSALIYVFGAICIIERMNIYIFLNNQIIINISVWMLTAVFGSSTIANIFSKSRSEKRLMIPVAVILFLSCLILAIG